MKWVYLLTTFLMACVVVAPAPPAMPLWLAIPAKAGWLLGAMSFAIATRREADRD